MTVTDPPLFPAPDPLVLIDVVLVGKRICPRSCHCISTRTTLPPAPAAVAAELITVLAVDVVLP